MILKIVAILCSSTLLQGSQELIPQPTTSVKKDITQDFFNLNEDLQTYILQYLEPDPEQFKTYLDDVQGSSDKITADLCGEYFYNFATNYDEFKKTGNYKQKRSELCTIKKAQENKLLHLICGQKSINNALLSLALDSGADVKAQGKSGYPILFLLLRNYFYHDEIIDLSKLLLKYGADVNQQSIYGNTLLHYIPNLNIGHSRIKPFDIIDNLKEHLHIGPSRMRPVPNDIMIIEFLLDHGARKNISNHDGILPFENTADPKLRNLLKPDDYQNTDNECCTIQ